MGFDSHPGLQRFFDSTFLLIPAAKFHSKQIKNFNCNWLRARAVLVDVFDHFDFGHCDQAFVYHFV